MGQIAKGQFISIMKSVVMDATGALLRGPSYMCGAGKTFVGWSHLSRDLKGEAENNLL